MVLVVEYVELNDLKEFKDNSKLHPEIQVSKIVKSIKRFGFTNPLLLDKDHNIIAGHGRLLAARKLGMDEVPCLFLEDLTPDEVRAYRIADNKLTESGWDEELLRKELEGLSFDQELLELTGFEERELAELMKLEEVVEDEVPPVPVVAKSKLGDIIELGVHRLVCGDSTDYASVIELMNGVKADMVFTDPPYGINYSGGRTQVVRNKDYGKIIGDSEKDITLFIKSIMNYMPENGDCYICLSPINLKDSLNEINDYDGIIVWKKQSPGLGYQWIRRYCEFIIFKSNRKKSKEDSSEFDFWDINTDNRQKYKHGTQKPVGLSSRAIKFSSKINDVVLDLFGGSGSTLIACEQTKRKCYMMEMDPKYVDVIITRYCNLVGSDKVVINGKEVNW